MIRIATLSVLAVIFLCSCGSTPNPRTGSEQSAAVQAQEDASAAKAKADSLWTQASEADVQSREQAARAASSANAADAEKARIASAVAKARAEALADAATRADAAAAKAREDAATASRRAAEERAREEAERQEAHDRRLAWWVAAGSTALAIAGAGLLLWLSAPRRLLAAPVLVAAGGWSLYAWALWATWIALAVGVALLAGIGIAAVHVVRHLLRDYDQNDVKAMPGVVRAVAGRLVPQAPSDPKGESCSE